MTPGNIILLNGAASADKTKIIAALQKVLDRPYRNARIDKFSAGMPGLAQGMHPSGAESQGQTYLAQPLKRFRPLGSQLLTGMHQTIATLARTGHHIIVNHTLLDTGWLHECAPLFCKLPTFFVGVRTSPIMLEPHKWESGSRTSDRAQAQCTAFHMPGIYDLELDTALCSPLECALQIKFRVLIGPPPSAMHQLKAWSAHTKQRGWTDKMNKPLSL